VTRKEFGAYLVLALVLGFSTGFTRAAFAGDKTVVVRYCPEAAR
jgi:hypothetical protein